MAELEERYGRAVVRLNRNEDLFPPLAGVREAVEAELANLWMYPEESYSDFRATVADWVGTTPESVALSKVLKKGGFRFVGPTTVYAAMQACGVVNDHLATCFVRDEVEQLHLSAMSGV